MIQIQSVVDGFNIILGTWITQLALFLTMCSSVRIPDYEDPDLVSSAKFTFSMLLISHLALIVATYAKTFMGRLCLSKLPIMMLLFITEIAYLCGRWVYNEDVYTAKDKTEK